MSDPTYRDLLYFLIAVYYCIYCNRMSMHMINRSRVMLSRCPSHRVCFCVDAGSGIGKIQEDVS